MPLLPVLVCHHKPHRLERAVERVQDKSEDFKRHSAEQRLIARFTENDRGVSFQAVVCDQALRDFSLQLRAVSQGESEGSLWAQAERFPCRGG